MSKLDTLPLRGLIPQPWGKIIIVVGIASLLSGLGMNAFLAVGIAILWPIWLATAISLGVVVAFFVAVTVAMVLDGISALARPWTQRRARNRLLDVILRQNAARSTRRFR